MYQRCVLSILLYGSGCWKMAEKDLETLSSFHTKIPRRILRIVWPTTTCIPNEDLLKISNQESMSTILLRRRWKWIGHIIRRDEDSFIKTALHWTPEGKRKRGRPRNTWRRTMESDLQSMGNKWGTTEKMAKDRQSWRISVVSLHADGITGSK